MNKTVHCCAECGEEGGVSLKVCKPCMLVRYCNADCQKNHWSTHKKECKQRASELRDEALFKDPPAKEDCPICFLPMPIKLISCISLPPATTTSVPIYDFAIANEGVAHEAMEEYYTCCGKSICGGCIYSFRKSGNNDYCPFCKAGWVVTDKEIVQELMKRVEANDAGAMCQLANHYYEGIFGLQQNQQKAMELWKQATELDSRYAHCFLGYVYYEGGDLKRAKFHTAAAAMAGHDAERCNLGTIEAQSGNLGRAIKHWTIAASTGNHTAMYNMLVNFKQGQGVSRDALISTLTAYNASCVEMRSEARDAAIRSYL